jgi:hypothetical protein
MVSLDDDAHTSLSQTVRSLHFEIDGLKLPALPFKEYAAEVEGLQHINVSYSGVVAHEAIRNRRFTRRSFKKYYVHDLQEVALQSNVLRNDAHHKLWVNAIMSFPNLEYVTVASGFAFHPKGNWISPYGNHCINDAEEMSEPLGVADVETILRGAGLAGTKLKTLHAGNVSWRLFDEIPGVEPLVTLAQPLSQLTTLKLMITTGSNQWDDIRLEAYKCSVIM